MSQREDVLGRGHAQAEQPYGLVVFNAIAGLTSALTLTAGSPVFFIGGIAVSGTSTLLLIVMVILGCIGSRQALGHLLRTGRVQGAGENLLLLHLAVIAGTLVAWALLHYYSDFPPAPTDQPHFRGGPGHGPDPREF